MSSETLITHNDPNSHVSEAYRMLRTNLYYSNIDKELKTILISSPNMGEGKTTTAINLAISLAQANNKTLFLGADLRKPRAYNLFGLANDKGLVQVVTKKMTFKEAIVAYEDVENLYILQSGMIPPHPSEMLQSETMKELMNQLKKDYEYIIIDAPPINLVSDTMTLATLSDGVIIVIAENQTKKDLAKQAVKYLKNIGANILGVVMTKSKKINSQYYYGR